jgi:ketosteroid isomerase-like protein
MTPEETAAVVHAAFAALNAGDLPAWLEAMHPDIEIRSRVVHSASGADWFRGYAGARAWWDAIDRTYDETRLIGEQVVVDGDRAVITVRARFVVGGDVVEHVAWQAARFVGRRFRVWARYDTEAEAYAAAGMQPGSGVRVAPAA